MPYAHQTCKICVSLYHAWIGEPDPAARIVAFRRYADHFDPPGFQREDHASGAVGTMARDAIEAAPTSDEHHARQAAYYAYLDSFPGRPDVVS